MANNKIQIKRSATNSTVPALSNGELAFTANGGILYIGHPDGTTGNIRIGGREFPGTLTANQALVANATSGIDKIIVANAAISQLNANGATGAAGNVLKSGGAGANSYWDSPAAVVAGSNSQVQFNANGALAGDAGFTYDGVTDTVTVAGAINVGANVVVNTTFIFVGNSTVNADLSSSLLQVANSTTIANVSAAGVQVYTNSTVNSTFSSALVQVSNSTSTANLTALDLKIGATTVVNSTQITATLFSGNISGSYANISGQVNTATLYAATSANIASAVQANATGIWTTGTVNGATISVGATFVANTITLNANGLVANLAGGFFTGYVNASGFSTTGSTNTGTFTATTSANVGANVQLTTTALTVGNSTVNSTHTSSLIQVSNSTSTANLTAIDLKIGATTVVNTIAVVATTLTGNLSATYANVSGQVNTGTLYVTTSANVGTFLTVNSTVVNSSVNTSIGANLTLTGALNSFGGTNTSITSNVTFTSANIDAASSLLRIRDIIASGNLIVGGTVVSVNTSQLMINDNIIQLADNNLTTDVVDSGWFNPSGNATTIWYSGMVRQASKSSNSNPYFWIFASNTNPNTATTVDTSANSSTGTLQAYLSPYGTGVAFVANSTAVTLTANATVNVNITANSLSLSTALPATSGGTGYNTYTSGDILIANSGNALTKLGIGTDGYVLQVNGTTVSWNTLDGGTF